MFRSIFALILLFVLSACASDGGPTIAEKDVNVDLAVAEHNETAEKKDRVICRREKRPGTNISRKVCRTAYQVDEERKQAELFMDRSRSTGAAVVE